MEDIKRKRLNSIRTLGLSTQPVYSTNPPEPEPKTAQTDTSTVGGRSLPMKPDAFGLVGGFPLPKPEQPDLIINPETSAIFEGSSTKTYKIRWYLMLSGKNLLETHKIGRDPTKSCRDLVQIRQDPARSRWDLVRSCRDSARSQRIWLNIGQILMDPTKITASEIKPKLTDELENPTRPEPADPTSILSQFRVLFWLTRKFQVGSELGTNPTRPVPWTPLKDTV